MLFIFFIPRYRSLRKIVLIGVGSALLVASLLLATAPRAHASTWCYWTGWHTFNCCDSWWPGEQDHQVNLKLCTYNGGQSWHIEETKYRCAAISTCDF